MKENYTFEEMNKNVDNALRADHSIHRPDMNDECVEFLIKFIREYGIVNILEFGFGGSTKLFNSLGCQVITIEDNVSYYLSAKYLFSNSNRIFPIFADIQRTYLLMTYFSTIVHLVFIDGSYRNEIMKALYHNPNNWNYIILHDSERDEYSQCINKLKEISEDISPEGINLFVCKRKK